MYKEHPVFKKPDNENVKVWRYMDFAKFVSLLERKALFFTRIDRLEDKFEGSFSKPLLDSSGSNEAVKGFTEEQLEQWLEQKRRQDSKFNKLLRRWTVVNCWCMSECESAAMWKLYLKSEEGVAIQSTFRRLADCFNDYKENDVWIGVLNYIDYGKDVIPVGNSLYPFIYKRKSFEHEKEIRAVISKAPFTGLYAGTGDVNEIYDEFNVFAVGFEVPVDLEILVEKVYVSPTSEKWFEELVRSAVKKYGLNKTVIKSSLADNSNNLG
jgi:hypothetical protein